MKHSVGWTDSADIYRELARKPALDAPWEIVAPQALCEAYVALCQATGIAANNPLLETVMDFTSPGTLRDQDLIRAVLRPLFDGSQEGLDNAIHAVDLARARALVFPVKWNEPFGLVVAEAMACGTPVIAYRRGSMEELIKDGKSGFVIESDIEKLVEAMKRVDQIDRSAVRKHVEDHFSKERMVDEYEKLYYALCKR